MLYLPSSGGFARHITDVMWTTLKLIGMDLDIKRQPNKIS